MSWRKFAALGVFAVVLGCDSDFLSDPSIAVTFRQGMLSDYVLQVNNMTTTKPLEVYVYAANETSSTRSGNIVVPANSTKEFGALEMPWKFREGDRGFVAAVKHSKKLFFSIEKDGQYKTWFGYNEIPEIDVRAETAKRLEAERIVRVKKEGELLAQSGRRLFESISIANKNRKVLGARYVWPKAKGSLKERTIEKAKKWKDKIVAKVKKISIENDECDIANMKFANSCEYFVALLDAHNVGSEIWSPSVVVTNGLSLSDILMVNDKEKISSENIKWSVIVDYEESLPDSIPVLISSGFPCELLRASWDGQESANEKITLNGMAGKPSELFAVVYKNGKVRWISAESAMLAVIYPAKFDAYANGYNKPLRYLTPKGIVEITKEVPQKEPKTLTEQQVIKMLNEGYRQANATNVKTRVAK